MKKYDVLPWLAFLTICSVGTTKAVADNEVANPTQPPCPNSPIPPNYNQPVLASCQAPHGSFLPYPLASSSPSPVNSLPLNPNCQACPTFCPPITSCYPTYPCPATCPPIPSPTDPKEDPQPSPENLRKCPPGTIEINGVCRLIYCGAQSIYREGKCLQIQCPEGTYWAGSRCEVLSEPIIHTITFNSSMTTHVNSMSSPVVINNINNVTINRPSAINIQDSSPVQSCADCEIDIEETIEQPKCCTVITPRICKPIIDGDKKKWHCYNKRYHRCGDFCVASTVLLKPPYPSGTENVSVLPPDNYLTECRESRTCADSKDMYDCSGCVIGLPENCSSYCYRYVCPTRRCKYISQRDFCTRYPEEQGCLEEDGCFDDWCGS